MRCEEAQDLLSEHLDGTLSAEEDRSLGRHLESCAPCRRELAELRWLTELLQQVPAEPMPEELPGRIFAALDALPDEAGPAPVAPPSADPARPQPEKGSPVMAAPWWKRGLNWPSALAGAAIAAAVIGFWGLQPSALPRIETAAVNVQTDVALNIGFDVDQNVDNVTFQINLPEGLKFIDDQRQPMLAQSVSWKGALKQGKTVVPITVRGVQPGRWEIEAYVKKGPMMRKTTIVVPVQAT
jgi:hypothetical protein